MYMYHICVLMQPWNTQVEENHDLIVSSSSEAWYIGIILKILRTQISWTDIRNFEHRSVFSLKLSIKEFSDTAFNTKYIVAQKR